MEGYIMSLIKDVLNGVSTMGSGVALKSPEAYNKTLYDGVISIMQNAVMPVAYVILGLLFMLELYNITIRTEGMSNSGFEIPFKAMFKIAICKIFLDSTPLVMGAVFAVSTSVISNIGNVFGSDAINLAANFDAMEKSLYKMDFAAKLLLSTQVTLIWLGKQLRTMGMLIVLDQIWNRVTRNRAIGKRTWIYMDEIYLLFQNEYSANYLFELYKRARKWGAIPTGITQNVEDLLISDLARRMLSNSDYIMMLNQAPSDRAELAQLLNISTQQLGYVTNANAGQGLLFSGSSIIPFIDKFPTELNLYKMMTTKPEEVQRE